MPIDGGLIVGYLTAALLRGGHRVADRTLDALLDRLTALVARRMGRGTLDRLKGHVRDENVQRDVGLTLDGAIKIDPSFARELAAVIADLDRRGGRQLINQVYARTNVQAFQDGIAVGGNFNVYPAADAHDYSDAPPWVKLCIVVGTAAAVAGLFVFGYTLFTDMPDLNDPDFGQTPRGLAVAAAVFFAGFVILGIGSLGGGLSKRR
jgi:hypothetical protein